MKLFDLFPEDELNAQIEAKMVKATPHPSGKLTIYNYTQMASFTPQLWNGVTDLCRGLIVDKDGELVSRGFSKFWNLNDLRHPETLMENLPSTPPTLTRKMDGSLGILYWLDGLPAIATRGSFTSDQSRWATKWINDRCMGDWPSGFTPLFEIIYPENQIVVRYDYSGLVLLAMVDIETGEEMSYEELTFWAERNFVRIVDKFDKPLSECALEDVPNEEGYVAAWERSGTTPLRVKIKYSAYCRIHKLLTQTSAIGVWEMLRDGQDIEDLMVDVPVEFSMWIRGIESKLRSEFKAIENAALVAMLEYEGEKNIANPEDKKAFALYAVTKGPLTPILFAMVTGKQYAPIIWKSIRPNGNDRVFTVDEE